MPKLKKDNIAIIIAALLIIAYIIFQFYSVSHIELVTQTATLTTVYEKIDATAIVVRDEHTIQKSSSGVTVPCISDGDKVKVGGNVAMNFSSSDAAERYSQYTAVKEQLAYYENLESMTVGQVASVETLNSEIADKVDEYVRTVSNQGAQYAADKGNEINDSILRRQMLIGENVNLVSIIQELRQQAEQLSTAKPDGYIKTDESGVFTSYTDGFEKAVDYEKAESTTVEQIKSAVKEFDTRKNENENLGKLVTSYKWYVMCVVSADEVMNLEDGDKVQVALKDGDDTVLTMQIVSGAQPEVGAKETALILKSNMMDSKLASLRKENIEIRISSKEGIKVPASALHVEKDKKGVYALISSQIKFRQAEVIYSDDDYVLLKFDPENKDGVRLYDKIIIQGKELSDGRVYT
ncbi:MAG: hypothetical protein IKF64_05650 [Eubacterium sp.]|nr:hypothetical protein [Eubacterium sp.]